MDPIITFVAVTHSIQYLYKFVKILNVYYSSVEIAYKIRAKDIIKHVDNLNNVVEITTYCVALKKPSNKKEKIKKISVANNRNNMSKKIHRFVCDTSHYFFIQRLEREERKRTRHEEILYEERKKRESTEDKINEKVLFKKGVLRDSVSRHYILPEKLLLDIYNGVLKNMVDPKWTAEDKQKIKNLICGDGNSAYDFKKYESLFYYVDLCDRKSKQPFKCSLLGDDLAYSVKNILWLQKKRDDLSTNDCAEIENKNICSV